MTQPIKKPQTLKSSKPAGKVVKPKPVKAGYFRAIDLLLASVAYAQKGMPKRAARALADAAQDPQIDQAMEYLNDQQVQSLDQVPEQEQDGLGFQDQQVMSETLARLIRSSQTAEAAADDDSEDDEEEDEAEDQEEEDEQDSEESSAEPSTETAGDDGEDDEDGLDLSVDQDEDDDGDAQEQQVQASVAERLSRAERNKARRV